MLVRGPADLEEETMSATRCTCIRDGGLVRLVVDPSCPAWRLHLEISAETLEARPR
jgi:hypothetical protein